mmetsp:Transcript_4935/g.11238  ORF Transcript_4935/g.11238 Transcript_4935/m.11238 type:complete len:257 (-) Transcript_4935:688-1458(-)
MNWRIKYSSFSSAVSNPSISRQIVEASARASFTSRPTALRDVSLSVYRWSLSDVCAITSEDTTWAASLSASAFASAESSRTSSSGAMKSISSRPFCSLAALKKVPLVVCTSENSSKRFSSLVFAPSTPIFLSRRRWCRCCAHSCRLYSMVLSKGTCSIVTIRVTTMVVMKSNSGSRNSHDSLSSRHTQASNSPPTVCADTHSDCVTIASQKPSSAYMRLAKKLFTNMKETTVPIAAAKWIVLEERAEAFVNRRTTK